MSADEPGWTAADVTVVVPTRNRPDRLARCLDALTSLSPPPGVVIVVDSASAVPADIVAVVGERARLLRCDQPGASRARNLGWQHADTAVVAFVDDDVRVDPAWAAEIVAPFARPGVVLVTGAVRVGERGSGKGAVAVTDDVAEGRFDRSALGNVGASANVALRREVLAAVDGFDAALGAGGRFRAAEDLDLFDRVLHHGDGWHTRGAVGLHDQWRSRSELLRLELDYGLGFGVRVSKLLRHDRRRGRRLLGYELRRLVADLAAELRRGHRFGVAARVAWSVAVSAGVVRGALVPLREGHLQPSNRWPR